MDKFQCWMPSWEYLHQTCKKTVKKMKEDNYNPDVIIALSRGGFVPARAICDFLIIKDLLSLKVDHWGITATKNGKAKIRYPLNINLTGKKVLVVDDITDTGESMVVSTHFIKTLNPAEIRTATAFHIKTSKFTPNYYGEEIDWKWVIFPWNYVEDMCNLIPKVLDEKKGRRIKKIKIDLMENFDIEISEEDVLEVLGELLEREQVSTQKNGWVKSSPIK